MDKYFDDMNLGTKFVTPGRTVEAADIINFAGISGDWHPLHTNEEFAKKIFGGRIAHGFLLLTIASGLSARGGSVRHNGDAIIAFFGMNSVRFLNPVKIGDTIHLEEEVVNKKESKKGDRGTITYKWSLKNQKDEVAMEVGEFVLMIKKKA